MPNGMGVGPRRKRPVNPWCGACKRRPSTALCDYPLDNRVATYTTCSKPVCDTCKTHRGALDFCPEHAG